MLQKVGYCHSCSRSQPKEAEVEEASMALQKQHGLVRRKETKQRIAAAVARRGVEARPGWLGGAGDGGGNGC